MRTTYWVNWVHVTLFQPPVVAYRTTSRTPIYAPMAAGMPRNLDMTTPTPTSCAVRYVRLTTKSITTETSLATAQPLLASMNSGTV